LQFYLFPSEESKEREPCEKRERDFSWISA